MLPTVASASENDRPASEVISSAARTSNPPMDRVTRNSTSTVSRSNNVFTVAMTRSVANDDRYWAWARTCAATSAA